jgi:phytoene dehydrogenase-like protein
MPTAYDAIVIGAGANGLVAAATLARAGLRVQLLERAGSTAGQASVHEFAPGFRAAPFAFDAGWVPPDVERELGLGTLERVMPETSFSVALGDRELLALSRDTVRAAAAIRRYGERDAEQWPAFLARMHALAGFLASLYALPPPDIAASHARAAWPLLAVARRFRALGRPAMTELMRTVPMSVAQLTEEWFEAAPLRAAVATAGVQDLRHGPRAGGTAFVLLHHHVGTPAGALRGRGVWRTGPDAFTLAAEAAARQHGVAIRTDATVARITVRDDAVTGVVLADGTELAAPRVLSAADPAHTLLGLIDPVWLDPELLLAVRNIRFRGCTAVVLYALDTLPEFGYAGSGTADALRGIVSLSRDIDALERAADAVKYGLVPERPHIEVTAPTLHWPALAPAGKHVLVARVHYAPYRLRADGEWDAACADVLAERVTAAIDSAAPGFSERVVHRTTLSPRDIERRFGVTEGALTHGELALDQILFMRPAAGIARYAMPLDGLYLCGAGTHPGPGVPGGPGWLAARQVLVRGRKTAVT